MRPSELDVRKRRAEQSFELREMRDLIAKLDESRPTLADDMRRQVQRLIEATVRMTAAEMVDLEDAAQ